MSLEATIQENTNAIRELIAALSRGVPVAASTVAAVVEQAKTEPTADAAKADTKAKKTEVKTEKAAEAPKAEESKPETLTQMTATEAVKALDGRANRPDDAPTYQATADAVTKLARTKGREAAVAVLTKFGAAKLPDVKPEQFAAVIAACEEAGA